MPIGKQTLYELVSRNFQYGSVLYKFGIPFYAYPDSTLIQVCSQQGLPLKPILKSLEDLQVPLHYQHNYFSELSVDLIIEYLRHAHSVFLKDKLPYFAGLVTNLDEKDIPVAKDLQILFPLFAEDFIHHIHEEEDTLFSYILQLYHAENQASQWGKLFMTMNKKSIAHFFNAHETHDDEMQGIREMTKDYDLPENAHLLWRVVYAELQAFEKELEIHAHIENHILFPKALVLEEIAKEKIQRIALLN
jgi:regulator of cell morphogenesis and NO signaling